MALGASHPDVSQALRIAGGDKELAAYLADPDTVCTFFVPTNEAMATSMKNLGKFVGLASQNASLQATTFNYHVIPGRALTAAQLAKLAPPRVMTRANETLYVWTRGGKPLIYSNPAYPVPLKAADIKAGRCLVHTIGTALVAPSTQPLITQWLEQLGTMPPPPPKSQWAPLQEPLAPPPGAPQLGQPEKTAANAYNEREDPLPAKQAPKSSGSSHRAVGTLASALGAAAVLAAALA